MLFTDIVGSTNLKQALGDRAAIALIQRHHALIRETLGLFAEAEEIDTAGDSFFCVFAKPSDAAHFALIVQRGVRDLARETGYPVLDRIGIHVGEVFIHQRSDAARDLFGIQIDTTARIMSLGGADQILLSRFAFDNARQVLRGHDLDGIGDLSWLNHGYYEMKGVEEPVEVCEVGEVGAAALLAPGDSEKAHRFHSPDAEPVLGWRPSAGQRVPNTQWTLVRALGEGGFGEVWLARHETLKQQRVIKFCFRADRARSLKREVTLFRILRERVGEQRGIVTVHDVFFDEPPFYIVMDYVDGSNLAEWATTHAPLAEVPLATRLEIVAQVADALQVAHDAGVIHRDVKPSNILIAESQGEPRVKLTDFGIGQVVNAEALAGMTQLGFTQTLLSASNGTGTQLYMAPELITGLPATTRSDLYSLGVVLYQLIVGDLTRPVTGDWAEDIEDPLLREDLRGCLAGDANKRFAGAGDLAIRLRTLDQRRTALAEEAASRAAGERRAYRRGLMRAAAAAFVIVALIAGLAVHSFQQSRLARESSRHAEKSTRAEAEARGKSEELLTRMELQRAEDLFAVDDHSGGLAYLARVLRRNPDDRLTGTRLLSALRDVSHLQPVLNFPRQDAPAAEVRWSPDGRSLAVLRGGTVEMWNSVTGSQFYHSANGAASSDVRFSPDGRRFATVGVDCQIFDSATGKATTGLLVHEGRQIISNVPCTHAAFSSDSRFIATTCFHQDAIVWNVESGEVMARIPMRSKAMAETSKFTDWWAATAVEFSPSGQMVAISRADGWVFVWDLATQQVIVSTQIASRRDGQLFFSPDGTRLYCAQGGEVIAIDLAKNQRLEWSLATGTEIISVALSPSGRELAVAHADRTVRFYATTDGSEQPGALTHPRIPSGVEFSADGARLLTFTPPAGLQVWDVASRRPLVVPLRKPVNSAVLSPSGQKIATAGKDGGVLIWRVEAAEALPMILPIGAALTAFHPDQRLLATNAGSAIDVWDWPTGKRVGPTMTHPPQIFSLAFYPSGDRLVSGGRNDASARTWDFRRGVETLPPLRSTGYIGSLSFSADGRLLCIGGNSKKTRVWDALAGSPVSPDFGETSNFQTITRDGSRVVIQSHKEDDPDAKGRAAQIFDAKTGALIGTAATDPSGVAFLRLAPDGKIFATISGEGAVRVWSAFDGTPLSPPMRPLSAVRQVSFSPDGSRLSLAGDQTVRVWDWKTNQPVGAALQHTETVRTAEFSPDGMRMATSAAGVLRIWDVETGRALTTNLPNHGGELGWTADGEQLVSWSSYPLVKICDLPRVDGVAPPWLADWAEAVAGQRLDRQGDLELLPADIEAATRARLAVVTGDDVYARTARWAASDPATRLLSPAGTLKVAELIGQLCAADRQYAAVEALRLAPKDARPWASIAISYLKGTETLNGAAAATLAEYVSRAEKLAANEPLTLEARALFSEKLGRFDEAVELGRRAFAAGGDRKLEIGLRLASLMARQERSAEVVDVIATAIADPQAGMVRLKEAHLLRSTALGKLGRLTEAGFDRCFALGIPQREKEAVRAEIDLSLHYNVRLDETIGGAAEFAEMPRGLITMAGTRFDARGIVQLRGVGKVPRSTDSYPSTNTGISIDQKCQKLHFLDASRSSYVTGAAVIARYVVHYEDGASESVPMQMGRDISDRYRSDDKVPTAPLVVAWSARKELWGKPGHVYLFKTTWQNPHPEKVVKSIDFVSGDVDAAPFLVAITAE